MFMICPTLDNGLFKILKVFYSKMNDEGIAVIDAFQVLHFFPK